MLKSGIDLTKPLQIVLYLRMSSDDQNPRSPEQQRATIMATIQRLGLPWVGVKVYTDSGVSGKLVRKRPEFQLMLRDIRSGVVAADAILVDTFERFGRAEELADIRRKLLQQNGVVLLTADTNFSDPTTSSGRVMSAFESMRATEDNRIKSHNVSRGKRDAVKLGHFPGGPVPFGYRLKSIMLNRNGRQELDYSVLEPDPETGWIIVKAFTLGVENAWGSTRITKALNADPAIPDKHKPFFDQTVHSWLKQELYTGVFRWGEFATDTIDDRRVRQRNDTKDVLRNEKFCEPLIDRVTWEKYQELRNIRAAGIKRARAAASAAEFGSKILLPVAPGLSLKYPLSGLVKCGHCGRVMTASSSRPYTTAAGHTSRYTRYVCPGYVSGVCVNKRRIPEEWIRNWVIDLLGRRLFGEPS